MQAHTVAAGANTEMKGLQHSSYIAHSNCHRQNLGTTLTNQPRTSMPSTVCRSIATKWDPISNKRLRFHTTQAQVSYNRSQQPMRPLQATVSEHRGEQSGSLCAGNGVHRESCAQKLHTAGVAGATRMEHWSHSDCSACNAKKLPLPHPNMEPFSPHLKWGYLPEQ